MRALELGTKTVVVCPMRLLQGAHNCRAFLQPLHPPPHPFPQKRQRCYCCKCALPSYSFLLLQPRKGSRTSRSDSTLSCHWRNEWSDGPKSTQVAWVKASKPSESDHVPGAMSMPLPLGLRAFC